MDPKDIYNRMRKFVFLENTLRAKNIESPMELTSPEFEKVKTAYNFEFNEYVLHKAAMLDIFNEHMDRRKLPKQTIPFVHKGKTLLQKQSATNDWVK